MAPCCTPRSCPAPHHAYPLHHIFLHRPFPDTLRLRHQRLRPPHSTRQLPAALSTLLSFSIEQDRWPDWTGTDQRNQFTFAALQNFAQLTGTPPKIRVGANSEDHNPCGPQPSRSSPTRSPRQLDHPYPEATSITVGDAYYSLSRFLPSGTHMVWGVNLGLDNVTNAVNMAKAIVGAFASAAVRASGVVLDRIEVGNEADLYKDNGLRPSNWTVSEYVADWISVAGPVAEAAGISGRNGPVTLQGAALRGRDSRHVRSSHWVYWTASLARPYQPLRFQVAKLNTRSLRSISQHQYSAAFCNGGDFPLVSFMSKTAVRGNLTIFEADIAASNAQGLPYILGETNSIACHGAPGVSNTAGAALWAIDYTLQAATLGMQEAFFHEGIGYKYNFIQPVTLNISTIDGSPLDPPSPPHIQPPYYAGLLIDTFVGRTGSAQLVELSVNDSNTSGYAAFEDGRLVRAAFVNLNAWLQSSTGDRPVVHIDLAFAGEGRQVTAAQAARLVIQHADDVANLTFAGQSYETPDVQPKGAVVEENITLADGLDLRATEAVLVRFY
ncbi:Beta-glucuronidase [Grifola frondosa]|uniref:Beta-glucuronidase n=1 Tax=Grifola frondosa TaxID=5627 RepID=A0A1C7LRN5_GRIFR|nr:Beta-glucuronidase [Grifola frondosa]